MCSSILQMMDVKDTDLQLEARCLTSFLNNGTFAYLQFCGTVPELKEYWNISVKIDANWSAAALTIHDGIEFGPVIWFQLVC